MHVQVALGVEGILNFFGEESAVLISDFVGSTFQVDIGPSFTFETIGLFDDIGTRSIVLWKRGFFGESGGQSEEKESREGFERHFGFHLLRGTG
jgi:hypothetical protein